MKTEYLLVALCVFVLFLLVSRKSSYEVACTQVDTSKTSEFAFYPRPCTIFNSMCTLNV
jgi:hypothetical protein